MGLAILLSAKSCCRLSWERWLYPLHLLGPVLPGCCRLQLTSLSSMIVFSLHFCANDWVVILCVCPGTLQDWWISIGLVVVQLRAVFCPSVQYLSLFCEAFSWTILDSSRFPLLHSGQVFHQLVCPLTAVLPQSFSNLTTLFSYPVFFSLFHAWGPDLPNTCRDFCHTVSRIWVLSFENITAKTGRDRLWLQTKRKFHNRNLTLLLSDSLSFHNKKSLYCKSDNIVYLYIHSTLS